MYGELNNRATVSHYDEKMPMNVTEGNTQQRINEISISEVDRGYIVRAGCKTFAISSKEELIEKLIGYINNPKDTERKYYEGKLFL